MAKSPSNPPAQTRSQTPGRESKPESGSSERARTDIEIEIERQIGPLVQGSTRDQIVRRVLSVVQEENFRGPLPHPKHLEAYESACPGAADRILKMAEETLAHNIAINKAASDHDADDRKLGMLLGFAALMALILGACLCAFLGLEVLAGLFLGAGALGIVSRFIVGRSGALKADEN